MLRYVVDSKPLSFIIENVRGLVYGVHAKKRFGRILRTLRRTHHVHWDILSPHDIANVPQSRGRVFVLGLRRGSKSGQLFQDNWQWPCKCPCDGLASFFPKLALEALPRNTASDRNIRFMDERITAGKLPMDVPFVLDLGCSKGRPQVVPDVSPCLTRSRASSRAFWIVRPCDVKSVPLVGHRLTSDDMARLQGYDITLASDLGKHLTEAQLRKAYGNAINLKVLSLLLGQLLPYLQC